MSDLFSDLRLLARLAPRMLSGFRARPPRVIDLELTNRCNLRCRMCWFYGENGVGDKHRGNELSTDEVFRVVDQAAQFGSALYLGGAEPFARRDFLDILDYIKARKLFAEFTTNGTLLDAAKIDTLVRLGVDHIAFSVDGPGPIHDDVRGEGTYRQVVDSIAELVRCKERRASRKPTISVNMTVSDGLVAQLGETVDELVTATDDGVDAFRIHQLWFITPRELKAHRAATSETLGCSSPGAGSHLIPTSELLDPTAIADEMQTLRRRAKVRSTPNLSPADLLKYYEEGGVLDQRCVAPFFALVIKPNGDVKFCPDEWIDDYVLGNVREESLEAIWNNARARTFRAALTRKKCFPACKRCSFMYSVRPQ